MPSRSRAASRLTCLRERVQHRSDKPFIRNNRDNSMQGMLAEQQVSRTAPLFNQLVMPPASEVPNNCANDEARQHDSQ
jgi:hypothetical protein